MSEYRLSKTNNKLPKVNEVNEVAKISSDTKLISTSKNYLVQVANTSKEICIKTIKALVKVTNKVLTTIGNKLANIDWSKLLLGLLKDLLIDSKEYSTVYRTETRTYRVRTRQVRADKPQEIKNINTSKIEEIETHKQKQIEATKQKSIKSKKNIKQIQKKQDNTFKITKEEPLMIEQNKENEN